MNRILLAVDDSPAALAAARSAIRLAVETRAQLRVVNVLPGARGEHGTDGSFEDADVARRRESAAQAVLRYVAALATDAGLAAETRALRGKPARTILHEATDWHADLIVIGRAGGVTSGSTTWGRPCSACWSSPRSRCWSCRRSCGPGDDARRQPRRIQSDPVLPTIDSTCRADCGIVRCDPAGALTSSAMPSTCAPLGRPGDNPRTSRAHQGARRNAHYTGVMASVRSLATMAFSWSRSSSSGPSSGQMRLNSSCWAWNARFVVRWKFGSSSCGGSGQPFSFAVLTSPGMATLPEVAQRAVVGLPVDLPLGHRVGSRDAPLRQDRSASRG